MNEEYKSVEPGTDLGLGLGYTDQYIQGRLTNLSGVGANADSMVDVKYVTTDSLSELVWSPHKGLSLRCADYSFNKRNSATLWDAAASNASFALPQSVIAEKSTSNNLLDNRTLILSKPETRTSEGKQTSNRTSPGDFAGMTTNVQMQTPEKEVRSYENETVSKAEVSVVCRKPEDLQATGGVGTADVEKVPVNEVLTMGRNDCPYLPVEVNRINETSMKQDEPELELEKVHNDLLDLGTIGRDIDEDKDIKAGNDVLQPLNTVSHPTILGKLESSAENDLQVTNDQNVRCDGSKIVATATDSFREVRGSNLQDEKENCKGSGDSASPTNSGLHRLQRKEKEKTLSDGDAQGRMLNNEDNSHASVESCTSAFLSTSKRRWSFEQQLVVGNKRAKKQHDNASDPKSNFGQDSSFMNWISNMMKGFSESIRNEAPSLDLTLAKPAVERGGGNEDIMDEKSTDPGLNGIGFQSIFRSLYSPSPIIRDEEVAPTASCQDQQEAKEVEGIQHGCDLNATPLACFGESENFGKQLLLNKDNGPTLLMQLKNSPEISCGSHQSRKTRSRENRNSYNLANGEETGDVMNKPTLGKCKSNSTENVDYDLLCGKANRPAGNSSNPLKSLWISRFSAKTSGIVANPETCNLDTKDPSVDDVDTADSKEQCSTSNTEASSGHKEFKSHNEKKSISQFKSILRSPKIRSPEAIASVFARRLGAFKHIIPSDLTLDIGDEHVTCFYCGTRGHNLHNCSKITEQEIEDRSRNIGLSNETVASTRGQQKSESRAALADRYDTGELQLTSRIGLSTKPEHAEDQKMDGLDVTDDPHIKTDLGFDCNSTKEIKSAAVSAPKFGIPRFREKDLKGSEMDHDDVFDDIFDAVKKLRLTRSNILKFMKSHMSLSHLDGFFLRIRLGKWEGLVDTGYHVACVRGAQAETSSISVLVRGVECQVQTQYISNHGFLEDELKAWWCTASKEGSRVLTQAADLRAKVKKKKELGF